MKRSWGWRILMLTILVCVFSLFWAGAPVTKKTPFAPVQTQATVPGEIKKIDPPLGKLTITSPKLNAAIINRQAGKSVPSQARITFGPEYGIN